jgi:hypothetical protein
MIGQRANHTDIDNSEAYVPRSSQAADSRSALKAVQYHLCGNRLWIRIHALGAYAVVSSKDHDARLGHGRHLAAEDSKTAIRHLFQSAKAALGLGEMTLPLGGLFQQARINRLNPPQRFNND